MFLSNSVEESKNFNRADINRIKKNPKLASFSYKQFSSQSKTNSFPKLSLVNNNLFPNIPCMIQYEITMLVAKF